MLGNFVAWMREGVALSTDGKKTLQQKADIRYGQQVAHDQSIQVGWRLGAARRGDPGEQEILRSARQGSGALIGVDRYHKGC